MIRKDSIYFSARGNGRELAVAAAAEMADRDDWPESVGIKAVDDRVLWVVGDSEIRFYYREQERQCPRAS